MHTRALETRYDGGNHDHIEHLGKPKNYHKHHSSKIQPSIPLKNSAKDFAKDSAKGSTMKMVIATTNEGKIAEISAGLAGLGWEFVDLRNIRVTLPPENAATYEENAALKACFVAAQTRMPALADDSGLEVMALLGAPGIYSARFGNKDNDLERNVHLLEKMRGVTDRRAKFITALVLAYPDGFLEVYRGEVEGQILLGPRGSEGFGYDPLFMPDGLNHTFGELPLKDKQSISHRGRALHALKLAHKDGPPSRQTIKVS